MMNGYDDSVVMGFGYWLGWLVGVPLILWTASGLFMVARPIEEVRGEHLRAKPLAIQPFVPVVPDLRGRPTEKLTLEQAIHVMTGKLAGHFNLNDRGVIAVGKRADIAVFDLDDTVMAASFVPWGIPSPLLSTYTRRFCKFRWGDR